MGRKKPKPRKRKQAGLAEEKGLNFILGVISGLVANLITELVRKLLS